MIRSLWFLSILIFYPSFAVQEAIPKGFSPSYLNGNKFSAPAVENSSGVEQSETTQFHLSLISPKSQVKKGEKFLVGILIQLPIEWHTYWSFAGDFGQAPKAKWKTIKNVEIRPRPFPKPQRKTLSINKESSYSFIYEKELLIPFEIFIEENYDKDFLPLELDWNWFICKDVCLSKKDSLKLNLKVGESFKNNVKVEKFFNFWVSLFPKELNVKSQFKVKDSKLIIDFYFENKIKCLDLFPKTNLDFTTTPPVLLSQGSNSCSFQVEKAQSNLSKISGLFIYSENEKEESALFQSYHKKRLNIFWFILLAFLGGLILNIMPCVLPIIFLKFYNTMQFKHLPQAKILFLNLSYALGVIISFLFLALIISVSKHTGESLGWGFHLQSPIFVTFLSLVFFSMAFYLLDFISFPTPKIPLLFKNEHLFSHFITGVLSTTAASPCTVPFMASAMGFAFSRNYIEIFIIFFFLGLGLSFPYLLLSLFPRVLRYIPGPGPWTQIIKKAFSIPLFLTSLWLIWILHLQTNLKIFLLGLTFFPLFIIWTLIKKTTAVKNFRYAVHTVFVCLFIFIFISQIYLNRSSTRKVSSQLIKTPTDLALDWKTFNSDQILFDKQNGANIFIAFGAEWCLTCKLNERIFNKKPFLDTVEKHNIQLYYGDWTRKTPEITQFLDSYNQQGVPFYIFFKGEEKLFIFSSLLFSDSFIKKLEELSQ